ncbi:phosphoenolpyruvate--protein phosphotransferase [candidate division TA06 bacterium]|uniref:Phosphoenolpyruvate-protein phosphotransferase n=1 Tax=candidate division TA06 bacterium TaxID=2250710 RepID=A0A933MJM8_UNCT6|nr:phosphoenolpyruvate--protein phosphotransferase [candidate division TA06 bacterium]
MNAEYRISGLAASPGIAIGRAFVYRKPTVSAVKYRVADTGREMEKFKSGLNRAKSEFTDLKHQIAQRMGEEAAAIWDAQLLMLDDPETFDGTARRIKELRQDAASSFKEVMEEVAQNMQNSSNAYLRERAADIRDMVWQVIKHIEAQSTLPMQDLPKDAIVLAAELSPADTALMFHKKILGFVTETGGKTSHTAIVARSLEIPAVVGAQNLLLKVSSGQELIVDGARGLAIFNPSPQTLETYREEQKVFLKHLANLKRLRRQKAVTKDGHQVELSANIEMPEETASVLSHGAKGVGLYRTEFLYLTSDHLPTEEEQFEVYRQVAEKLAPDPVIFRTFDLGGDKLDNKTGPLSEANPFMGWRAIRFCLDRPEVLKTQLRAILRASAFGKVKIMLPMICCLSEVISAKQLIAGVKQELSSQGLKFDPECQMGIMVETPSAALTSAQLAKEVDFFSIGSNDLTQYTLAVDRSNQKVAKLYDPFNPAVLRLIREVSEQGHRAGIWVGMCGEMCADPLAMPLLLGLGLDEFSMNPASVPEIKRMIMHLSVDECRKVAANVMEESDPAVIRRMLFDFVVQILPDLKLAGQICSLEPN